MSRQVRVPLGTCWLGCGERLCFIRRRSRPLGYPTVIPNGGHGLGVARLLLAAARDLGAVHWYSLVIEVGLDAVPVPPSAMVQPRGDEGGVSTVTTELIRQRFGKSGVKAYLIRALKTTMKGYGE